jgi:hypothetical protein
VTNGELYAKWRLEFLAPLNYTAGCVTINYRIVYCGALVEAMIYSYRNKLAKSEISEIFIAALKIIFY